MLYTHAAPYLGVGVEQAVGLVGEDLYEGCKQSNETNQPTNTGIAKVRI